MTGKNTPGPSFKDLTNMINSVMGQDVLTEKQMEQIMNGAKKANERDGIEGVLGYLMKVTQADVDQSELKEFAHQVQEDPSLGLDILQGKTKINRKKK
jgi:hypothetical protein